MRLLIQDTETIEQIDKDVKRTHPDIPFFSAEQGRPRGEATQAKD